MLEPRRKCFDQQITALYIGMTNSSHLPTFLTSNAHTYIHTYTHKKAHSIYRLTSLSLWVVKQATQSAKSARSSLWRGGNVNKVKKEAHFKNVYYKFGFFYFHFLLGLPLNRIWNVWIYIIKLSYRWKNIFLVSFIMKNFTSLTYSNW